MMMWQQDILIKKKALSMQRHNLFMFVFLVGLINAMVRPMRVHITEFGFYDSLISGFGISFIVWFAVYCSFDLLRKASVEPVNYKNFIAVFIVMVAMIIPSAFISWIILSLFAVYCGFFVFKSGTIERNASLIMLAIALRVPVSDICLKLFADVLLQFDAAATLSLTGLIATDITRQGNIIIGQNGHELLIMTGCASFTNISLALLLWFTVVRTQVLHWQHYLSFYIIPLGMIVMGINIVRLAMMSLSREHYYFYHEGLGADIVNVLILVVALGTALLSVYLEKRKCREAQHVA